jgi:tetratricopeptide (TPR) repeat protein
MAGAYVSLSELLGMFNLDTITPLCEKARSVAEKALNTKSPAKSKKSLLVILSDALSNIGYVYYSQGDIPRALEYHHKTLKIYKEIHYKHGMGISYNNIGGIYKDQGNLTEGLNYHQKSLKIREEIGEELGMGVSYNNIGAIYRDQGDTAEALDYFFHSLNVREKIGDKYGISNSCNNIGNIYMGQGNIPKALTFGLKALNLAQEIGNPGQIKFAAKLLSTIYEKQGKGMKALEMYKLHVQMKDSINNEETQKATIRQQTQYEFEKAQIVKENEAKEEARIIEEETGRRNNLQYSLIFLGILVLFGVILSLGFIKVSPTIAEGIIFFAFLILFEFILVFSEPYLEQYTNGEPMYNLLANSVLALLIFPVHALLERLLKKRIVR